DPAEAERLVHRLRPGDAWLPRGCAPESDPLCGSAPVMALEPRPPLRLGAEESDVARLAADVAAPASRPARGARTSPDRSAAHASRAGFFRSPPWTSLHRRHDVRSYRAPRPLAPPSSAPRSIIP